MRRILQAALVLAIVFGLSAVALAAGDCPVCTNTTSDNHLVKTGSPLTRGAAKGLGEIVTAPMPKAKDGSQIATDCPVCMWGA